MSAMLFAGCTLLAIPILIPINMVGGIASTGQSSMTIANVKDSWRLWFHLILTYIFCGAAMALLWREMREYTQRRHAYLMSERHNKTPQSTTILVTAIPKGLNTEEALFDIFDGFPGGVSKIWLNRHPKDILKLCKERDELVPKLEMAEYNYIRSAYSKKAQKDPSFKDPVRPFGRVSGLPFVGKKVDLINYYTERLAHLNYEIESAQQTGSLSSLNSAFIQFNSQFGAHSAVQTVVHPKPFKMAPMYSEISPLDVVWDNMNLSTVVTKGRRLFILAVSTAMILFWTIPTLFISSIASLADVVQTFHFLAFLQKLPPTAIGIVEGILPPLMLAGLMALLPVILTTMATYEGHVQHSAITHSLMSKFFLFLVVNVLLISTLTKGFLGTYHQLEMTGFRLDDILRLVSVNLPESSVLFINYVLLRGFTGPALELIQVAPLLLNFLYTNLMAKSPRQIWDVQGRLESVNYGVLFPQQTLIFCIGMVYSTIAPLILPFVTFYFTVYYFVYRHQFLYVYSQPIETGGLAFPKAVKQVYTGIFISEITLFGIFVLKQATFHAVPHLVLMIILFAMTALSLSNMNEAFNPLVTFLPVALFSKDLHMDRHGVVTDGDEVKPKSKRQQKRDLEQQRHQQQQQQHQDDIERPSADGTIMTLENLSSKNLTSNQVAAAGSISSPLDHLQVLPQEITSKNRARTEPLHHTTYHMDIDSLAPPHSQHHQYQQEHQQPSQHHATIDMSHLHPDQFLRPNISYDSREWGSTDRSHHMPPQTFHEQSRRYQSEDDITRLSSLGHIARFPSHSSLNSRPASLYDRPVSYAAAGRPASFNHKNNTGHNNSRPTSFYDHHRQDTNEGGNGGNGGPWPEVSETDAELERLQDRAYCHPAIYNTQKPVWLPMDERGLMQAEIDKLSNRGIVVATDGAYLDAKTSKASVGGLIYAPGEEAQYRLERGE
ncbi:hypothetical protein BGZ95_010037 [Linnemannia exigua]|uniref:DUF221-domain-containing protein n=1 Tax=Linnemannia exigua TaxID=604196 RepID=A0AAD4DBT8_9FUNG|nr:hypothetical protein BGZ95_010037 [Linnemannia exigua]